MALDVKVTIDLLKPVGSLGLGYPLIIQSGADVAVEYTECANIDEVIAAGFDNTSKVYEAASLIFAQNKTPKKIAVCAITETDVATFLPTIAGKEWRQLIVIGAETTTAISAYIETTRDKMFFTTVAKAPTTAATYNRTVTFVYSGSTYADTAVAAVVGATAGYNAGAITYKNIIINGLVAQNFTATELTAMHKAGAFTVVEKAGDIVTSEGIVNSGEYIDIMDAQDWIIQQIEYKTQKLLNNQPKIPYDNTGIAMLESVTNGVLKTAYDNGMIATNADGSPAYTVSYALREDCDAGDIAARKYLGGKFAFTLSGAIHYVEVNGEISVA